MQKTILDIAPREIRQNVRTLGAFDNSRQTGSPRNQEHDRNVDNTLHTIMARLPRGHTSEDNACKKYEKSNRYRENTRASAINWQLESCAPCTEWRRQDMNGTLRSIAISQTPGNEKGWRTMQYQQLHPQQLKRRKKQDIFLLETDNLRGPAFQVVAGQNWTERRGGQALRNVCWHYPSTG